MKESHGIVVTDLAFLPDSLDGRNLRGDNEAAMLSVAVDSRCQVHAVPNPSKPSTSTSSTSLTCVDLFPCCPGWLPVWLLLVLSGLLVVGAVVLLQQLFPGWI